MSPQQRRHNVVEVYASRAPENARALWTMQDTRSRTLEELDGVTSAMVDWLPTPGHALRGASQPPDGESSIGTVLYHLAGIEADWLYAEVLEQPEFPPDVVALFPYEVRDAQGHLTQVTGVSLAEHLQRLAVVRRLLLDVFEVMELAEFRRVRALPPYDVTPEWVLHHLMQHEAEHRSQIGALRARAQRQLNSG
jgi:uncharacterized damage-inducible protein DinB